jgi:pimeloyl-ACP methyl ester carboxylesterase
MAVFSSKAFGDEKEYASGSVLAVAFSWPMIRWFEHRQVYVPSREFVGEARDLGSPFEDVTFAAADGTFLNGWFFSARPVSSRSAIALLLLHGNAGNISHRLNFAKAWLELGLNVFLFDYRGYGRSEGRPTEAGTYLDAQGAMRWLDKRGFQGPTVVALGKSLGGGVASELALREPLRALILQSTFSGIPDIGSELFPWLPVRRMHSIHYDTVSKLPRIHIPVLIAHSRTDSLIGFHHAERNFQAANEPKQLLEIAGSHTDVLETGRAEYLQGLDQFLRRHVDARSSAVQRDGDPR